MRYDLSKGETAEEVFKISEEDSKKVMEFLSQLLTEEERIDEAIFRIYKKAKNSRELGYMIMYYTSLLSALGFDEVMDEMSDSSLSDSSSDEGMYR